MLDFVRIFARKKSKSSVVDILPEYEVIDSKHLIIKGGKFYAIYNENTGFWSTNPFDAINIIDGYVKEYANKYKKEHEGAEVKCHLLCNSGSKEIDKWRKFCNQQMFDNHDGKELDVKMIFADYEPTPEDYATHKLSYSLVDEPTPACDEIMNTFYEPEERRKIQWVTGAILTGDSKTVEKTLVFYGEGGTGKGTVINKIMQPLFKGYYVSFHAKTLGNGNSQFPLQDLRDNPLVAFDSDGDLSKLNDNTILNGVISHETLAVNTKNKDSYDVTFRTFLIMASNKPVNITDVYSGLNRRVIDVQTTGNKIHPDKYRELIKKIKYELGGIAYRCVQVYKSNKNMYMNYIPIRMIERTNVFYSFMTSDSVQFVLDKHKKEDSIDGMTLAEGWSLYKAFSEEAGLTYKMSRPDFNSEFRNYFEHFIKDGRGPNGKHVRGYVYGLKREKFMEPSDGVEENVVGDKVIDIPKWLVFKKQESAFDKACADFPAQLAKTDVNGNEIPRVAWKNCKTTLKNLVTTEVHYVKFPEGKDSIITIDFDKKNEKGEKDIYENIKAVVESGLPQTYAEPSKSGKGIHLEYYWTGGDIRDLSSILDVDVEIKVFPAEKGGALRRKSGLCNDLEIATLNSGLPLKGEDVKVVTDKSIKSEKSLRILVERNLRKEIHSNTRQSVSFIKQILDDAYASDLSYDISDMRNAVTAFAASSSHQAQACLADVAQMKFKSKEIYDEIESDPSREDEVKDDIPMVYDIESYPNLFLICYKDYGKGKTVNALVNPKPVEVEMWLQEHQYAIDFNGRYYDRHIVYAVANEGYTVPEAYQLSQNIINTKGKGEKKKFTFGQAYGLFKKSIDVYDIYAKKDMSLKKWEIKLGMNHEEMSIPWDKPVPKELIDKVIHYCKNDVLATEAVFDAIQPQYRAREILADLAGGSVSDTSNQLSAKFIFNGNRHPQSQFNYRNLAEKGKNMFCYKDFLAGKDVTGMKPYFPGYVYDGNKSTYRGELVSEGGFVHVEPGIYFNLHVEDSASHHPHSVFGEELFGPEYTARYREIYELRYAIKHKDFDKAAKMFDGKPAKYLGNKDDAKALSNALKIVINSVYGESSAKFDNPFRDPRNIDNIVAKRGALTMIDIMKAVQDKGFQVVHVKTDSIKIRDATPEIIKFVRDMGKAYGYIFECEEEYERICLVDKSCFAAVYNDNKEVNGDLAGTWDMKGTKFIEPYIEKSLFTHEEITIDDLAQVKSVSGGRLIYLDVNEDLPDVSAFETEQERRLFNKKLAENPDPSGKKRPRKLNPDFAKYSDQDIIDIIARGHKYQFVGKVGSFVPMKPGCGGALMMCKDEDKYTFVSGGKDYRWLETETVKNLHKEDDIDMSFYESKAQDIKDLINKFQPPTFDEFVDKSYKPPIDISKEMNPPIIDHVEPIDDLSFLEPPTDVPNITKIPF